MDKVEYERIIIKYPELKGLSEIAAMSEPQLRQLYQTYGNFPTGDYYHIKDYGTFDHKHFSVGKSAYIIEQVRKASQLPSGMKHIFRIGPQTLLPNMFGLQLRELASYEAHYWASGGIRADQVNGVALAIQMDFEHRWETWQGMSIVGKTSSYASEDLPSDYLGFYLASRGFIRADSKSLAFAFAQLGCFDVSDKPTPVFGLHRGQNGISAGWFRNYVMQPIITDGNGLRKNVPWPSAMQIDYIPSTFGLWGFTGGYGTGPLGPYIGIP